MERTCFCAHHKDNQGLLLSAKGDLWRPSRRKTCLIELAGYNPLEIISEGRYSKVRKAYSKRLHLNVAIKCILKTKMEKEVVEKFLPRHIEIIRTLSHPGLPAIYEIFESPFVTYVVMEYLPEGDLLTYINAKGSLPEAEARHIFKQLVDVIGHCHGKLTCHRSIKCEHILFDNDRNIRLTDFSFSRHAFKNDMLQTTCGTLVYTAPEVLEKEPYSGTAADIWSMGVCLYAMICGRLPFPDVDLPTVREAMKKPCHFTKPASKDGKDIVKSMLDTDPANRLKLDGIQRHVWMQTPLTSTELLLPASLESLTSDKPRRRSSLADKEHGLTCEQPHARSKHDEARVRRVSAFLDIASTIESQKRRPKSYSQPKLVHRPSLAFPEAPWPLAVSGGRDSIPRPSQSDEEQLQLRSRDSRVLEMSAEIGGEAGGRRPSEATLPPSTDDRAPEPRTSVALTASARKVSAGRRTSKMAEFLAPCQLTSRFPALRMTQDDALAKMIEARLMEIEKDLFRVRHMVSAKVARTCGTRKRSMSELVQTEMTDRVLGDFLNIICLIKPPDEKYQIDA